MQFDTATSSDEDNRRETAAEATVSVADHPASERDRTAGSFHSRPPSRTEELELKLEASPSALKTLLEDRSLTKPSGSRSLSEVSVYYDTVDFQLRKNGYALRVRQVGDRVFQTLKTLSQSAGVFDRDEWESEIGRFRPESDCLADTPLVGFQVEQLEPVIRCDTERTAFRVKAEGSELEVAVDLGTLSASELKTVISELEIEVVHGEASAAIHLAQRAAIKVPLKLAVMSKVERGFSLLDGTLSKPRSAEPIELDRGMTVADAVETIAFACLRHFRLNEPIVIRSRDDEALHQARVGLRRLRSALALFRPVLADVQFDHVKSELNWLSAELTDARTLDVYLGRELPEPQRTFVAERRTLAYDLAVLALESQRSRLLMLEIVEWLAAGPWRLHSLASTPVEPFARRRIERLWAKLSKSKRIAVMDDQQRHRLRIAVKKLRYSMEFVAALHLEKRRRTKKSGKTLQRVQNLLGDIHDGVTARSLANLNPWLTTPKAYSLDDEVLIGRADEEMKRLRKIARGWR